MARRAITRWIVGVVAVVAVVAALAVPVGATPPPWAGPPSSGDQPATAIGICCTWGNGIKDGIQYTIVGAPDPATEAAMDAGIQEWATAIHDKDLLFEKVSSGAEVTIRFKRGGGTVAGSTSRSASGGFITGASMAISGKAFGTTNSAQEIETVTAHEWGHVLGLNHANGTGVLMSPVLDANVPSVTPCDIGAAELALDWFLDNPDGTPTAPPSSYAC